MSKILSRLEMIKDGKTSDDTYDVLLLSGGGDWGVFGAGLLNGWAENENLPRPEFDYLAGISTGSLIAAYTFSGEQKRYENIEQFYLKTDEDFVTLGSLGGLLPILRADPAIANTSKVEKAVKSAIDQSLVDDILNGNKENKILVAGAVNLDLGVFTAFDIGGDLERSQDPEKRLYKILMASSAVPAAFPPIEIDGDLYADGGASVGIPIFKLGKIPALLKRWNKNHQTKPPRIRFWIIFNNKIGVPPQVTDLGWADVLIRSYKIVLQTTLTNPLYSLEIISRIAKQNNHADIELHWVSIPEDFKESDADVAFDPTLMKNLRDLGRQTGKKAESWKQKVPEI